MRRKRWMISHCWLGLIIAGLLLVIGLTSRLRAFYFALGSMFNPSVYAISHGKPLKSGELVR